MTAISKVPLLDLTRSDPALDDELRATFDRVLRSGMFILGPEVAAFEAECAERLGVAHAVGVSSGTDALLLALMTLGVGPGDEVICPTYTFFASAGTIWRLGARPVFVDIDPVTFNCDPAAIEAAVTDRTKAIMPVHLYGQSADMAPILEIARRRGVAVVEDAAQAITTRYEDRCVGALGTFGCFSFFPTKNLGCLGDGGLVTTDDAELAERANVLRVHGGKPKYHHGLVGGNFRIDALQAALLRVKLPHLDASTERRRQNAARYEALFRAADVVGEAPIDPDGARIALPAVVRDHTYNQFALRVPRRDAMRAFLAERGVGTEIYYPIPLHLQGCFASLGHGEGDFPHSERAAGETLALPIFPDLRDDEIRCVVDRVVEFLRR